MTDPVLVLGGTGKTGRRLVRLLADRGVPSRPAGRHPGAGGTLFDWDRAETHTEALAGAGALYLVAPELVSDPTPLTGPFLKQAAAVGVTRVVALSAMGVDADTGGPEPGMRRMERQVTDSGLVWTILRPAAFAQNFSEGFLAPGIRAAGSVPAPTGQGSVAFVDAADIAAVAAVALTEDGHTGATYTLTGPEALTYGAATEIIAAAAGKPVSHHDIPHDEMETMLTDNGLPADYTGMLLSFFAAIRNGWAATVTDDVERVTGRPATSFADFARAAAGSWR